METTNRIMVRGYVFVSGGGSAPSVEAYIQGASHTRLEIPVGATSVEKFIPYEGAIKNVNLGSKNLTANHLQSNSALISKLNSSQITSDNIDSSMVNISNNLTLNVFEIKEEGGNLIIDLG
jgi:hypothetical protein